MLRSARQFQRTLGRRSRARSLASRLRRDVELPATIVNGHDGAFSDAQLLGEPIGNGNLKVVVDDDADAAARREELIAARGEGDL